MTQDHRAIEGGQPLDITQFLAGRSLASGVFQDRFGRVRRSFQVTVHGRWDGQTFVLDEAFVYDDGERELRQWRIVKTADGRFTASCADCVGTAQGTANADGWRMRYGFRLKLKTRALVVRFDDRMTRVSANIAINRARVSKWGMTLGEVMIVFERQGVERQGLERQDDVRRMATYAEAAE